MKSLTQYIFESQEIQSVWKRTAANAVETAKIQDTLKSFFVSNKDKKVSLANAQECKRFFKEFVGKLSFGSYTQNLNVLRKYHLDTPERFKNFILKSEKEFEDKKFNVSCIKDFDLGELEKEFKTKKKNGEIPDSVDKKDAKDTDVCFYDMYDADNMVVFPFSGSITKNKHDVNMLKMEAWKYHLGTTYYTTNACYYDYYTKHYEEIKKRIANKIFDTDEDPNEFK